ERLQARTQNALAGQRDDAMRIARIGMVGLDQAMKEALGASDVQAHDDVCDADRYDRGRHARCSCSHDWKVSTHHRRAEWSCSPSWCWRQACRMGAAFK